MLTIRIRHRALPLLLAPLLAACGGGGGNTNPLPTTPAIPNPPATCAAGTTLAERLVGTWKRGCHEVGGSWETDIHVFRADGSYTGITTFYNGTDCTGDALPVTNNGTYVLGNPVTTAGGLEATEIDITIEALAGGTNTKYDIVYIDGTDTLYMATFPAFAADSRPDALDFTLPLRCQ